MTAGVAPCRRELAHVPALPTGQLDLFEAPVSVLSRWQVAMLEAQVDLLSRQSVALTELYEVGETFEVVARRHGLGVVALATQYRRVRRRWTQLSVSAGVVTPAERCHGSKP